MADIKTVGVLGCGLMGSGIAQVVAQAGYRTIIREVSQALNDKGKAGITKSLDKSVEKGKLPKEDRDATLGRLTFTTKVGDLASCDIIIEAVTEDLETKNALWKELDGLCGAGTIFASNTSSLTVAAMAAATQRRDVRSSHGLRALAGQGAHRRERQLGVHRQPAVGPLSTGRDPRPGARRRERAGHRQGHGPRVRVSDGSLHAARLRGAGHHLQD